jgi:hypothetical protein
MRFGEHFCAARFYKSGKCRGNCVEIVLEFGFGAVGFLINGAQRALTASSFVLHLPPGKPETPFMSSTNG